MTADRTTGFTDIDRQHWSLALPAAVGAALRTAGALGPADRHLAADAALLVVAGAGRGAGMGPPGGLDGAVRAGRARHARGGLHLERHRRPQGRCPGRAHARPAIAVGRSDAAQRPDLDGAAVAGRRRHPLQVQQVRRRRGARLADPGRHLPDDEAPDLVAAGRAGAGLQLGRPGGLCRGHRHAVVGHVRALCRRRRLDDGLRHDLRHAGPARRCRDRRALDGPALCRGAAALAHAVRRAGARGVGAGRPSRGARPLLFRDPGWPSRCTSPGRSPS